MTYPPWNVGQVAFAVKSIHMPALGVGQSEGTLLRWLKAAGDPVASGEPIAEIETDKTAMDLESPADGWLSSTLVDPGSVVPIGTVLGEIRERDDPPARAHSGPTRIGAAHPPSAPQGGAGPTAPDAPPSLRPQPDRRQHELSPRQRRIAAEAEAIGFAGPGWVRGRHRQSIARRVSEAWREIPHFAVVREVRADRLRSRLADFRKTEPRATLTDLFLEGLAYALRSEGATGAVPIGLAVATPDGVVVPVITDTSSGLHAIVAQRVDAVSRAQSGRVSPSDLDPGPLATLSNLGLSGVDAFTGVIATGQVALLTVGRVGLRPTVDATGSVVAAETFQATLNVDHRSIDGDVAARLLASFAAACETSINS